MDSVSGNFSYQHKLTSTPASRLQLFANNTKLLEMFNAVHYTLLTNTDIIESIPYFIEVVDKFQTNLHLYQKFSTELKNNITSLYLQILVPLRKYGNVNSSNTFINLSSVNEETLKNVPENVLIYECKLLLKHLEDHSGLFSSDTFTDSKINEFSEKVKAYEKLTSINLIDFNQNDQFGCISSLLKLLNSKIDSMVNHLKKTHPNFYYEYRKARKYYYDKPQNINN